MIDRSTNPSRRLSIPLSFWARYRFSLPSEVFYATQCMLHIHLPHYLRPPVSNPPHPCTQTHSCPIGSIIPIHLHYFLLSQYAKISSQIHPWVIRLTDYTIYTQPSQIRRSPLYPIAQPIFQYPLSPIQPSLNMALTMSHRI